MRADSVLLLLQLLDFVTHRVMNGQTPFLFHIAW